MTTFKQLFEGEVVDGPKFRYSDHKRRVGRNSDKTYDYHDREMNERGAKIDGSRYGDDFNHSSSTDTVHTVGTHTDRGYLKTSHTFKGPGKGKVEHEWDGDPLPSYNQMYGKPSLKLSSHPTLRPKPPGANDN